MTNIVKSLIELTNESGMKHKELAKRMGCDESRVCRYFKGAYEPGSEMLSRWAEALGRRLEAVEDFEYPFNEERSDDVIEILNEVNRNLLIRKENAERALRRIRFEVEDNADYYDAIVNADIAKGLYLALQIIDKEMKGEQNDNH